MYEAIFYNSVCTPLKSMEEIHIILTAFFCLDFFSEDFTIDSARSIPAIHVYTNTHEVVKILGRPLQ